MGLSNVSRSRHLQSLWRLVKTRFRFHRPHDVESGRAPLKRALVGALLLLLLIVVHLCFAAYFFQGAPSFALVADQRALAPPLSERVFPFQDLCQAAVAFRRHRHQQPAHGENPLTNAGLYNGNGRTADHRGPYQRLRILHNRGPAALRWSNATGLPLSPRVAHTVAVRFVTISTQVNTLLQASTTAATMAGAMLDVVGVNWSWFSFEKRLALILSYVDEVKLADADVVVVTDVDAAFSGEDGETALEAFLASTAANADEHSTYHVRDIRLGKRLPPVLLSAETNCMHVQAYPVKHMCSSEYDVVDQLMEEAARDREEARIFREERRCPLRYLNAGVVVARVWALRLLWTAMQAFMSSHKPYYGDTWWCDQSVLASLYLQLRWWEIQSNVLAGAPRPLDAAAWSRCPFAPLVLLPTMAGHGPHGLPGGLLGLDRAGRFSVVITLETTRTGVLRVGGYPLTTSRSPENAIAAYLDTQRRLEPSTVSLWRSSHRLDITPSPGIKCGRGSLTVSGSRACVYRSAVLGMPDEAEAVTPLIWHFAGTSKRAVMTQFRAVFPWYTPMLWNATLRAAVIATLLAAPASRVWLTNSSTDAPVIGLKVAVSPRVTAVNDLAFERLCVRSAA